jgi:hypothetical protein
MEGFYFFTKPYCYYMAIVASHSYTTGNSIDHYKISLLIVNHSSMQNFETSSA